MVMDQVETESPPVPRLQSGASAVLRTIALLRRKVTAFSARRPDVESVDLPLQRQRQIFGTYMAIPQRAHIQTKAYSLDRASMKTLNR